jgi:transpeptidase family protein/penicillin-binding protein
MIQSRTVTAMFYRALTRRPRTRTRRALPVVALAAGAFALGAIAGAGAGPSPSERLAAGFAAAWARSDYARMYLDLDAASRRATPATEFAAEYEKALRVATATHLRVAGKPRQAGGSIEVPVRVGTRVFGTLALGFRLRVTNVGGERLLRWSPSLAFPGLEPGETLSRQTALPPRARLLARDGGVLAEGSPTTPGPRPSPVSETASGLVGALGPAPAGEQQALEARGLPPGAMVGVSGLERGLDARLAGTPGGQLWAVRAGRPARVLASAPPRAAPPLRTTISARLERAAVLALGGQYGGIVALSPASGEILAVSGIGLDGLQPPGSTFKMVTLSGVLTAGVAQPHSQFAYATYATLDGVKLSNAHGEECGGTLELAFAVSCNSVFAPLGVKLGAPRLVAMAEAFGFNGDPGVEGAPRSTIPPAGAIRGELELGSTAIGQGQVQATPLQMAIVAATVADAGHRPRPTFTPAPRGAGARVLAPEVARTVRRMMMGVVANGTGTAAAIPGVTVAGKTGTAELKSESELKRECASSRTQAGEGKSREAGGEGASSEHRGAGCQGAASEPSNTDAWFAAFAPATHARVAVCVLLVKDGAGGETAAPAARQVLEAGLSRAP